MKAFHNDPKLKEFYISRVRHHRELDNLVQGSGWDNGKGCAIGCTLENYDHNQYEKELGVPEWLARLEDTIFEGLPKKEAMLWPERFLSAVRVGDDLERVKTPFLIYILEQNLISLDALPDMTLFPEVLKAIEGSRAAVVDVIRCHHENDTEAAWSAASAESAAWSAASAESAASAARSAAESAESAAGSAAWSARSAEWGVAWSVAWSAAYLKYADKLIEIIGAQS